MPGSKRRCAVISRERRSARRFFLRLPLTLRWTDESVVGEVATETLDASSRGLYFHLPKELRCGCLVEMVITLPHEMTHAGPILVQGHGRVVRNSAEYSGNVGVAATVERYEFLRSDTLQA